ncbi:hypothetical protein ACI78Q_13885 [Geodermatophilus sp. SYSU D00705]
MSATVVSIVVAVLAAATSVGSAIISVRGQRHAAREAAERAAEERTQALIDRYQEPLLRAAYDLQSRLFNILARGLLDAGHISREYTEQSTVWLFGQYFGWAEILRREAQFLRLREQSQQAAVQRLLGNIAHACSSDSRGGSRLQIQRSEQRALGELMVIEGRDADGRVRSDCLGYAAFSKELEDPASEIHRWFTPFCAQVWPKPGDSNRRLVHLQHALIDLIELLDPDRVRFSDHRSKVES